MTKAIAIALLLLGLNTTVNAQTMVLACPGWWGTSGPFNTSASCITGCSGPKWTAPDANDAVKTDAAPYWTKWSTLANTAKVLTATGKAEGSAASCSQATIKSKAEVLGTVTPPPNPPPDPPMVADTVISWTVPVSCSDGSSLSQCPTTGYRLEYGQSDFASTVSVGPTIQQYTLTGLATGNWGARVVTLSGSTQSAPGQPTFWTVVANQPAPWLVAANSGLANRPAYEAVLPITGSALVQGHQDGLIAIGRPCGDEVFKAGTLSYRTVLNADVTFESPTYATRAHVAVCAQ